MISFANISIIARKDLKEALNNRWFDVGLGYVWRNFENRLEEVRQQGFDTRFIRLWRLYLAYCEAGFDEGRIDVVQLQLVKERTL